MSSINEFSVHSCQLISGPMDRMKGRSVVILQGMNAISEEYKFVKKSECL